MAGEDIAICAKTMGRENFCKMKLHIPNFIQSEGYPKLCWPKTIYVFCWRGLSVYLWIKAEYLNNIFGIRSGLHFRFYNVYLNICCLAMGPTRLSLKFIYFVYTLYTWCNDFYRIFIVLIFYK